MPFLITLLCAGLIALSSVASIFLFYPNAVEPPAVNIPGAVISIVLSILSVLLMSAWQRFSARRQVKKGQMLQLDADFSDYTPADKATRILLLSFVGVSVNTYSNIPRIIVFVIGIVCIIVADIKCVEWNNARKSQYSERCEKEGHPVGDGYQPYCRWGVFYLILSALSLIGDFMSAFRG